jgi:hypothetical protein
MRRGRLLFFRALSLWSSRARSQKKPEAEEKTTTKKEKATSEKEKAEFALYPFCLATLKARFWSPKYNNNI